MNCQRNINSTLPTQLPHKFSYIVAILGHNHFESPNITTLKILVKSEICRACEVNWNHKKFILTPVHTLHLQRISAATRAGLVIVEMKEKTFRNILDIAKKAGVTRRF
jgi:hypothetical protein